MKIRYYTFILLALLFVGCKEKVELDKGEEPLSVSLSTNTVLCQQLMANHVALQISWTAGTNHQTGSAISYDLYIDTVGNNFLAGKHFAIGKTDSRVLTFTHRELNALIHQYFPSIEEEMSATLEIQMCATVLMTGEKQLSETVMLTVTSYKERILNLYLIGDATPNGWDNQAATAMTLDPDDLDHFTWSGVLNKGEMKLLTQLGDWLPCYVKDEDDENKMVFRPTEDTYPDYKWYIPSRSNYSVDVNVEALTISITDLGGEVPEEKISHLYMIGDATPGGWDWAYVTEMTQDDTNPAIFTYNGTLKAGEIKFPVEIRTDWSGDFLLAPTPNCPPTENGTYIIANQPDNKWVIPAEGQWSIEINLDNTTISFIQL